MKTTIISFIIVFFCAGYYTTLSAQSKQPVRKKQANIKPVHSNVKNKNTAVTDEPVNGMYPDSVKYLMDSAMQIMDSIKEAKQWQEEQEAFKKVYNQYYYPADSLSYIDGITASLMKSNSNIELDDACALISKKFSSPLQKARAIYFWVASTVRYDFFGLSHNTIMPIYDNDSDAVRTFKYKIGVCQNYSNLYQYMCTKAGVECETLNGWGKNFPYAISTVSDTDQETNHAWNAVKTKKGWILIDVTWAATDSAIVDNYWFNTPPKEFIYSHLPSDSSYQLVKPLVSKRQFFDYPIVSDMFFKSKFDFDVPDIGSFVLSGNTFSITVPQSIKGYALSYDLIPFKGSDWQNYNDVTYTHQQSDDTKIIPDKKNNAINYEVTFPSKGVWWLAVNVTRNINNKHTNSINYYRCLMFKVTFR